MPYLLTLPPYGFYWFLLSEADDWPSLHTPAPEPMPEYQTIVMRHALPEAVTAARSVIEQEILPPYLAKRRWFAMKDQALRSARIALMTRVLFRRCGAAGNRDRNGVRRPPAGCCR